MEPNFASGAAGLGWADLGWAGAGLGLGLGWLGWAGLGGLRWAGGWLGGLCWAIVGGLTCLKLKRKLVQEKMEGCPEKIRIANSNEQFPFIFFLKV